MVRYVGWPLSKHWLHVRCAVASVPRPFFFVRFIRLIVFVLLSSNRFRCDRRRWIYSFISFRLSYIFFLVSSSSFSFSPLSLSLFPCSECVCFCKQCLLVHTIARAAYKIRYLTKSNCELFCLHTPRRLFYMIFFCCCSFLFLSILLVQFVVSNDTTCSLFMCCKHSSVLEHTALDTEPKTYLHGSVRYVCEREHYYFCLRHQPHHLIFFFYVVIFTQV